MNVSDIVLNKINKLKTGYVFTYDDFSMPVNKSGALKQALNRLVKSGKIVRVSKGRFYKPEKGIIGNLQPDEYQIVKDLLNDGNKIIGYLTGISAFNKLSLTTQVSNTIQIGTNNLKKPITRGKYNIRFILQKNTINKSNIFLLQILDSLRFIKRIPNSNPDLSCKRISNIIQALSADDKRYILKLALKYNPSTRALAGAILEPMLGEDATANIYNSLKPQTDFNPGILEKTLKNKTKWRIQ